MTKDDAETADNKSGRLLALVKKMHGDPNAKIVPSETKHATWSGGRLTDLARKAYAKK